MDYVLSEQQQAFRETAMRFAKEKLAPHYQKRATAERIDRALIREMGALGEKHRHLVQPVLLHVEAGVHRAHDHAVAQRGAAYLQGRQQMRIKRRPRTGLHGVAPYGQRCELSNTC